MNYTCNYIKTLFLHHIQFNINISIADVAVLRKLCYVGIGIIIFWYYFGIIFVLFL